MSADEESARMENSKNNLSRGVRIWLRLMEIGRRAGCHQMEERSFSFRGYQFPVCARCTGVLLGQLLAIPLLIIGIRFSWWALAILIGIMGVDWLIQHLKIRESTNFRRLITGTTCGIGGLYLEFYAICFLIKLVGRTF